ncbi:MAG: DUF2513 domain-containing protein [Eubacteriales bacterium]
MKLNPDCIRDILLFIEDKTDLSTPVRISPNSIPKALSSYPSNELMYHIKQLELSSLIHVLSWTMDGSATIHYLLPEGHAFLANIEPESQWNKFKNIFMELGIKSLPSIISFSAEYMEKIGSAYINKM